MVLDSTGAYAKWSWGVGVKLGSGGMKFPSWSKLPSTTCSSCSRDKCIGVGSWASSPISDDMGDSGEEGVMRGDAGVELFRDMGASGRKIREEAGERGGGEEGGSGDDGVRISSASILLSLSLVRGGSVSIDDSNIGEVGRDGSVTGDDAEVTSGSTVLFCVPPSGSGSGEASMEGGVDGAD